MQVRVSIRVSDGPGHYTDVSVQERTWTVSDASQVNDDMFSVVSDLQHATAASVDQYIRTIGETSAA